MSDVKVYHGQQVRELDTTPVLRIEVNSGPISGIAISVDGSRLMVTNYGDDSVSVIDTDTSQVVETIFDVREPRTIAVDGRSARRAYVSTVSAAFDSIDVIDVSANTVVATHQLALSVSDLTTSPDGKYVYISRNGACCADIAVLDTTTGLVEVIDIASTPGTTTECVRVSSDGGRLYVGVNGPEGGRLVVIRTPAQLDDDSRSRGRSRKPRKNTGGSRRGSGRTGFGIDGVVETGSLMRDIALSSNGNVAYIASCTPDFGAVVDVIDTRTYKITGTCKIGEISGFVTGLTLSAGGDRAYLVSDDRLTVLCTLTQDIMGTVKGVNRPSCVVESPDGQYLYIADYTGVVTVAPVASTMASGIERGVFESDADNQAEWAVSELLESEAALA